MGNIETRLVLGTAQFGMKYGINNKKGQLCRLELEKVFDFVNDKKICLDTSSAYGTSEAIVGNMATSDVAIITKISPKEPEHAKPALLHSLNKLGRDKVHGCLLHDFSIIKKQPKVWDAFVNLKRDGYINKIGFSVYYPSQITYLLNNGIPFDIIQFPYSIVDQRFSSVMGVLKKYNVELYARSIFLQGLFFKNLTVAEREKFSSLLKPLKAIRDISKNKGIPISHICINFALLNRFVDKVVFGINSYSDLLINLNTNNNMECTRLIYEELLTLHKNHDSMILPINW